MGNLFGGWGGFLSRVSHGLNITKCVRPAAYTVTYIGSLSHHVKLEGLIE